MAKMNTVNISRILRLIWMRRGISRIEISRALGLDKSTVTNITTRLLNDGLIVCLEEGEASSRGGRKPIGLAVNRDHGSILGIELGTDRIMAAVIDLQGRKLLLRQLPYDTPGMLLEESFTAAYEAISEDLKTLRMPLLGIGIGLSGLIDQQKGVVRQSIPLGISEEYPILEKLQGLIDVPIFIDNDANCCCYDEMVRSDREREDNFIFVLAEDRFHNRQPNSSRIGFAVGFGLVVNGEVHRGADFSAGEFQSILWKSKNTSQFSIDDAIMSEPEKHPEAIEKTLHELAAHVAFIANVLDLSRVVIGGGLEKYGEQQISIFNDEIQKNWSYERQTNCEVCMVHDGDYAVALGAASMYLEHLFSIPMISLEDSSTAPKSGYDLFEQIGQSSRS